MSIKSAKQHVQGELNKAAIKFADEFPEMTEKQQSALVGFISTQCALSYANAVDEFNSAKAEHANAAQLYKIVTEEAVRVGKQLDDQLAFFIESITEAEAKTKAYVSEAFDAVLDRYKDNLVQVMAGTQNALNEFLEDTKNEQQEALGALEQHFKTNANEILMEMFSSEVTQLRGEIADLRKQLAKQAFLTHSLAA